MNDDRCPIMLGKNMLAEYQCTLNDRHVAEYHVDSNKNRWNTGGYDPRIGDIEKR